MIITLIHFKTKVVIIQLIKHTPARRQFMSPARGLLKIRCLFKLIIILNRYQAIFIEFLYKLTFKFIVAKIQIAAKLRPVARPGGDCLFLSENLSYKNGLFLI